MSPRQRLLLAGCAAPAGVFFLAFWLLPVLRLLALPAEKGWGTYFVVLTDGRYMESMLNTVLLSVGYVPTPLAPKGAHVHLVGDCDGIGNLRTVIWRAWDVAMAI